ncbi:hypothetical protein BS78_09G076400 [Paspalum vaginatum]|nr:hypothetical protein BS78_09G076400 [Paspalum vaginatum]
MGRERGTGAAYLCILLVILATVSCASREYQVLDLKDDIMKHCRHFMDKHLGNGDPNYHSLCCEDVRKANNIMQICQDFTDEDKAKIEMWKWLKVTRKCGNALEVGANCAGYHVPPPLC